MPALRNGSLGQYQRGWAGMLMLLLALLAVGWLARSMLKDMGLSDGPSTAIVTGNAQRTPVGTPAAGVDTPTATVAAPLDRARGVQAEVLRQGAATQERLNRVDR